jgi:WD40 repeat protein
MPPRIALVHQFQHHQDETWDAHFSLDGTRLVSSDGHALYLWQLNERGGWDYERSLLFGGATFPRFAPNGTMLAFGSVEKFIRLISVEGKELATFPSPSHAHWAFSPDGRWLVSSDTGPTIVLWDLTTYQSTSIPISFPALDEAVFGLQFTPDGQRLVLGISSPEGYVHICHFDPEHQCIRRQKTLPRQSMIASAIAPNGKMLAIMDNKRGLGPYEPEVFLYDLESFQLLQKLPRTTEDEGRYSLLIFSPDSQFLMSSKDDGTVDIWSTSSCEHLVSFAAHPELTSQWSDPIGGLDWSKTGFLVTGGASVFEKDMQKTDYSVKIWRREE